LPDIGERIDKTHSPHLQLQRTARGHDQSRFWSQKANEIVWL